MWKEFQKLSPKLFGLNSKKTKVNYTLPEEFIIAKFYEFGFKVSHDRYSNTYKCCCPICREGKSWGRKTRCFYIPSNNQIYCHNCGQGWSPFNWIKEVSGKTDEEIQDEVDLGEYDIVDILDLDSDSLEERLIPSLPEDSINLFDPLQQNYYKTNFVVREALAYIKRRRLDVAINRPDAYYISLKDFTHKNRLIIPFKNEAGKIIFYQSRQIIDDDKGTYISKTNSDKSLYGIDNVTCKWNDVFIFEGPLDASFVRNGVGLAGISKGEFNMTSLQRSQLEGLMGYGRIWCLDSQWIDDTSREKTEKLIAQGEKVFLWPEEFGKRYKDFNEICVDKKINEISPVFIQKNSFRGKEAVLKFKMLKVKM